MNSDLFLLRTALRDVLRPRRLVAALVLVILPALMALVWRSVTPAAQFDPAETYNGLAANLLFGFILPILAVIYGTGVVSQEIEQRTIVYLLTRPVPRWRILLAKFVGSFIAITVTVGLSALLLALVVYGPGKIGASRLGTDLRILPVGALAYGSLFLLLATLVARPLTYGLLFAFGWESWVPRLPGAFSRLSVLSYLRSLAPHLAEVAKAEAEDAVASGGPEALFQTTAAVPGAIPVSHAWLTIAAIVVVTLGGALLAFSLREYAPREDAE